MKIVEYPVALFLKAWHYLFADIFGWDAAQSWLLALILLIVTVRGLLLPFVYRQSYSSRILVNIRPKVYRLEQEYRSWLGSAANCKRNTNTGFRMVAFLRWFSFLFCWACTAC